MAKFVENLDGSSKIIRDSQIEHLDTELIVDEKFEDEIDVNEERPDNKIEYNCAKLVLILLTNSNQVSV